MKILILTSGWLPVPAVKGGAVESLIDYIIDENEFQRKLKITVVSSFDEKAVEYSQKYNSSIFKFIKFPRFIRIMDDILYFIAKNILKKKKVLTYKFIFKRLWLVKKIKKILLYGSYDKVIMENHVSLLLAFKNKKIKNKYKGKVYYHDHNVINNDIGCKDIILYCKKIITVSDYISSEFLKKYPEYDKKNVVKLPNVADLNKFGKVDIKFKKKLCKKLGIHENEKIVMFAGRLDETKGALEVIQAFAKLNLSNAKLVIVGSYAYQTNTSNGYDEKLHQLVGANNNIVFTGFIDFNKMPTIYKMADIMVLPSIWDDPAPLSIIESLCSGCVLITTESGGIPEYAKDISIILKRDEHLVDSIAENISILLHNEEKRKSLAEKAYLATRDWTTEWYYKNYIDILQQ